MAAGQSISHGEHRRLAAVLGGKHPRSTQTICVRVYQPVQLPAPQQGTVGTIPCHKGTQLRKLFLRVLGQIQLKAEGASKCCRHPCFHRGDVAGAVVGHGGKVCAHHTAGVEQAGAILDD